MDRAALHSGWPAGPNSRVKVLGEAYTLDDEEDMCVKDVIGLYIPLARDKISIREAIAGNWVLLMALTSANKSGTKPFAGDH